MTEDATLDDHEAEFIFRHYFDREETTSQIGRARRRSHKTIEAILSGDKFSDDTEALRARYPKYEEVAQRRSRRAGPLSDDQLAEMFRLYHDEGWLLKDIAAKFGFPGRYFTVRAILAGDQEADRTEALRAQYPKYEYKRTAISFEDDELEDIFKSYFLGVARPDNPDGYRESLQAIADRYRNGWRRTTPHTIRDLIEGRHGAEYTRELREKYGDRVRSPGRGAWTRRYAKQKPAPVAPVAD